MQWLDLVSSGVGRSPSGPENGTSPPGPPRACLDHPRTLRKLPEVAFQATVKLPRHLIQGPARRHAPPIRCTPTTSSLGMV
ncbi:hypothetical protein ACKKBG_A21500 [Auxenochlorella protothecoides x Auxenochlorella symbiontica]